MTVRIKNMGATLATIIIEETKSLISGFIDYDDDDDTAWNLSRLLKLKYHSSLQFSYRVYHVHILDDIL